MRKKMIDYLEVKNPYNFIFVLKKNKEIIKAQKYEMAMFCYRNNEKVKGGLIMLTVLDVFIRNFEFKEIFKLRLIVF
jgi:hypothetical protein